MSNTCKPFKPCLVLGTGFHRWVLGENCNKSFNPLISLERLLNECGNRMGVALPKMHNQPTLLWETLLVRALQDGFRDSNGGIKSFVKSKKTGPSIAAYRVEAHARRICSNILAEAQNFYPHYSARASLPRTGDWGSVISLNFDTAWLSEGDWAAADITKRIGLTQDMVRSTDRCRISKWRQVASTEMNSSFRLWFPNGCIASPESLRMGFRDFGMQVSGILNAFNLLMKTERSNGVKDESLVFEMWAHRIRDEFESNSAGASKINGILPITWVTDFIYRPLFIAGVGLSSSESGLWWLLVQRARLQAKIPSENRPPVRLLIRADDPRLEFWRSRPCNIEPIVCSTWDEGSERMQRMVENTPGENE